MNPSNECENQCREYVTTLLAPTEVGKKLGVSMRHVNHLGRALNLGIMVAGGRLYPPDDVRRMEEHRASRRYGPGKSPRKKAEEVQAETKQSKPIALSPAYAAQVARMRGETE